MGILKMEKPQLLLEKMGQQWQGKCPLCDEVFLVAKDSLFRDAIAQQGQLNAAFDRHLVNKHGLGNVLFEKK